MSLEALSARPHLAATRSGLLVAVVGPSGAGKDTLIARAVTALGGEPRIVFARRVVTRPADLSSEDHDSLDLAAFDDAEAAGAFCLTWRAHGLAYGLPLACLENCRDGRVVVANVSRRALAPAMARFPALCVVEVTAARELLIARIAARGRESEAEIRARVDRQLAVEPPPGAAHLRIDNSGDPQEAVELFLAHLSRLLAG